MECHQPKTSQAPSSEGIILIGNPNVGKSVIFGHLTGNYATVSNYPGTTVDYTVGTCHIGNKHREVVDTPGTYSLIPKSEDEKVARDVLLSRNPYCVVQVGDAKNPRRTLDLTLQLLETGLPMILVLNMIDEAQERGITPNAKKLSDILGIPVITTSAITGMGIPALKKALHQVNPPNIKTEYSPAVETLLFEIESRLPEDLSAKRSIATMLMCGDESVHEVFPDILDNESSLQIRKTLQQHQSRFSKPIHAILVEERLSQADCIINLTWTFQEQVKSPWREKLSRLSTHPFWGLLGALGVLYLMYLFVGQFAAGTLVGFLENNLFGQHINPFVSHWAQRLIPWTLGQDLLIGEYGVFTMALTYALALILPIVTAFFLFFGILEDTGYLPRLAVVMDRFFRTMGLNGKAVLPMVLGLGCDTMATLTTRILESKKERLLTTLLLTLAVPCSAQLGVIMGMLGNLSIYATLIWLGFVLGSMLGVGYLASRVLPGDKSPFVLEIPPFRIPSVKNLGIKTIARLEWYIKEAVPMFVVATLFLFVLDKTGILTMIERWGEPIVVYLLGLPKEASEAFLIGFLRRDYGAAELYNLGQKNLLSPVQVVVSLVTMTLFVPCFAQFLVNIKERGLKSAIVISIFVFGFAFAAGGLLNFILKMFPVPLG